MIDAEIVSIIIQGGAVGILLVFGLFGYRIATLAINKISVFVNNHLQHNTEAIQEGTEVMRDVKTELIRMSGKLDTHNEEAVRKLTGWEGE